VLTLVWARSYEYSTPNHREKWKGGGAVHISLDAVKMESDRISLRKGPPKCHRVAILVTSSRTGQSSSR
jgi:hypothetical protein